MRPKNINELKAPNYELNCVKPAILLRLMENATSWCIDLDRRLLTGVIFKK
jgi:hypothetical protein